jgi:Flp pilus assembly protein TadD
VEEEAARTREAVGGALALDETIPEAHIALASLSYSYDHDWGAAERGFRRALELNPSHAPARRAYALGLMSRGRFDEAIEQLKLAEQLDPLAVLTTKNMAMTLYCARRCDEAIRVARRHLEMDPQFFPARDIIGLCEAQRDRFAEAISESEKGAAQGGRSATTLGPLGNALARSGRLAEARPVVAEVESIQKGGGIAGAALAMIHTGLGERKQGIESLRQAADAHDTDVTFIGADPAFDPLRGEPEFQTLCARLGLPAVEKR